MVHHAFTSMACNITLLIDAPNSSDALNVLYAAEFQMQRLAAMMTRFDSSSELSRLNTSGSARCTPELFAVIERAVVAHEQSDGTFDPTVHDAMVRAGYDRTFGLLDAAPLDHSMRHENARSPLVPAPTDRTPVSLPIELDPRSRRITLHDGARLDLGGIAKGWIADQICAQLSDFAPALVNAGGDIACSPRAHGESWVVEVERDTIDLAAGTTGRSQPLALALDAGGIATSGIDRRRWRSDLRQVRHHIIDPQTGTPVDTDVLVVTVIADSCVDAEIVATQLVLVGYEHACELARSRQLAAVIARHDGFVTMTGPLA